MALNNTCITFGVFSLSLALTYLHPHNRLQSNGKIIAEKRASSSSQIYGDPLPGRPICTELTESMLIFFSVHLNKQMKELVKHLVAWLKFGTSLKVSPRNVGLI